MVAAIVTRWSHPVQLLTQTPTTHRCRYWIRVRFPDHRLRSQPVAQAAVVLVRHSWIRPV